MKSNHKPIKSPFKGPKRTEIFGKHFELDQILVHTKTGNEFRIKEIQSAGFITYMTKTLGKDLDSTQRFYVSYGALDEYK